MLSKRLVCALCALAGTAVLSAQTTAPALEPAVDFPAAPTPRPVAPPLTAEGVDAHFMPREIDADSSSAMAVVYNGNRRSQVGPCGCVSKQLGGIDKEGRLVELLKEKTIPAVKVDAGGYLKDVFTDFDVQRSKAALRAMGAMGFDAVNVGYTDLGAGVKTLQETAKAANVPLISANVVDPSGKLVFEPYRVETMKLRSGEEVRVAFVGVTRPRLAAGMAPRWTPTPTPSMDGESTPTAARLGTMTERERAMGSETGSPGASLEAYTVADPVEALQKILPELKEKSDVIVLLSYARRDGVKQQLEQLGELANSVDVAVAGEYNAAQTNVHRHGPSRIVSAGYEGRQVGLLMFEVAGGDIRNEAHKWIEIEQSIPSVPELTEIIDETKSATTGQLGGSTQHVPPSPAPAGEQPQANAGYLNVR